MKKHNLKRLALLGVAIAIVVANQASAEEKKSDLKVLTNISDGNLGYHLMTEDELLLELNPDGATLYKTLSPDEKLLARKVASTMCQGTNECAGLGIDKDSCAGKNACQGKGICALSDKNQAVKLVAKKMAEKRANATK